MATTTLGTVLHHLRRSVVRQDAAALTDGELLECFIARRDEAAFEALVHRHGPMIYGVCRRVLRSEADAEDAFQATFLVLVRKAGTVRPRGMVGNWLYGVAHSTALKARAMAVKRSAKEREAAARRKPDADAGTNERLHALLDQELKALPDKYRAAIVLCDLEGKTIKDAARQLGCPTGTVGTRLARGRGLLSRRLAARHGLTVSGAVIGTAIAGNAASAGVPASLLTSTIKAASLFAAGHAVAGVAGVKAAALTEGVLRTMLLTKLKLATGILLAVAAVSLGAVGFADQKPAQGPAAEKAKPGGQVFVKTGLETADDDRQTARGSQVDVKGNVQGVLEDVDIQNRTITVVLPEILGINKKGEVEKSKPVRLQDLFVTARAKIWVNDKEGQLSDLKKKMSVTVTLKVLNSIWVTEIDAAD